MAECKWAKGQLFYQYGDGYFLFYLYFYYVLYIFSSEILMTLITPCISASLPDWKQNIRTAATSEGQKRNSGSKVKVGNVWFYLCTYEGTVYCALRGQAFLCCCDRILNNRWMCIFVTCANAKHLHVFVVRASITRANRKIYTYKKASLINISWTQTLSAHANVCTCYPELEMYTNNALWAWETSTMLWVISFWAQTASWVGVCIRFVK